MKNYVLSILMFFFFTNVNGAILTELDGFKWQPYSEYGYSGAKSEKGDILVPARYETCYYERGHFSVKTFSGLTGIFSKEGKVIIPANKYQNVMSPERGLSVYVVIGPEGWGVKSADGKELIPEIYDAISLLEVAGGYYYQVNKSGYQGIIDDKGKIIISPERHFNIVSMIDDKKNGITYSFVIYGNGQKTMSGVCDSKGKELIRTNYFMTKLVSDNSGDKYYEVTMGNSTGRMSLDGKILVAPEPYEKETRQWGVSPAWYLVCNEKNKYGAKDSNKKELIPCVYDMVQLTEDRKYFQVRDGIYMGLYSLTGKCIVPTSSHNIVVYSDESGITFMTEDYKSGMVDDDGKIIVYPKFKYVDLIRPSAYRGEDGIVVWCKDRGRVGVQSKNGQSIIPCEYDNITVLSRKDDYFIVVHLGNKRGMFSKNGKSMIPIDYESIDLYNYGINADKGFFYVNNGGKIGVYSLEGKQLINAETFSSIKYDYYNKSFKAIDGNRTCIFDEDGFLLSDNSSDIKRDEFIRQADAAFERRDYKSSASLYGKAIDIKPSASLYFNRGVSLYNRDNYIEAIADFERCLNNNPSFNLRERSLDLIGKAKVYQAEKEYKREQMAGAIFGLVFSAANIYMQSQMPKGTNRNAIGHQYNDDSYDDEGSSTDIGYSSSRTSKSRSSGAVCTICHGGGDCLSCHGDGIRTDNQFGTGQDPTKKCGVCGGTGICNICKGTGRQN